MRGNVIELAIGVIIGGAFGAITTSLVSDILMPLLGVFTGGIDFSTLSYKIGEKSVIAYGKFIQSIITFLILAFAIFMMVKVINQFSKKKEAEPVAPTKDQELLAEIRDLLKK